MSFEAQRRDQNCRLGIQVDQTKVVVVNNKSLGLHEERRMAKSQR